MAEHKQRLASSELLRRRIREARETRILARVKALWYLDPKFRPLYWTENAK